MVPSHPHSLPDTVGDRDGRTQTGPGRLLNVWDSTHVLWGPGNVVHSETGLTPSLSYPGHPGYPVHSLSPLEGLQCAVTEFGFRSRESCFGFNTPECVEGRDLLLKFSMDPPSTHGR